MVGEQWIIGVIGFILGFFSCMILWFYIEKKNAERENEE